MNYFLIAFSTVLIMLAYACPGFIMIKTKLLPSDSISAFAKLLLYVCQPMLIISSIQRVGYSFDMVKKMGFVLIFMTLAQCVMVGVAYIVMRKKTSDAKNRIYIISTCLGNFAFMGVPILEALLPEYPEAVTLSAMASLSLNIIGWTLASAIIANNKSYINLKKLFLNPAVIGLYVAIPLFILNIKLPTQVGDMVSLLGKMTTPLCMLIMGMRLATTSPRSVFARPFQYLIIAIKQIVFPLVCLGLLFLIPIDANIRATVFIMMCCPIASMVLNFSEIIGEGQDTAAALVLLSTVLSTITIPFMVLLI